MTEPRARAPGAPGMALDDGLPPSGLERWLDSRLRSAPGWTVSLAVHGLVLALLASLSVGAGADALLPGDGVLVTLAPARGEARPQAQAPAEPAPVSVARPPAPPEPGPGPGASTSERPATSETPPAPAVEPPAGGSGLGEDAGAGQAREKVYEITISASLAWLARHQEPSGGWSSAGFSARCAGPACSGPGAAEGDVVASGLALLAFLDSGYTPLTRGTYVDLHSGERQRPGRTVKRALDWLLLRQAPDGRLSADPLGHAVATLALTEAWGFTHGAAYKGPAQRAVDHLLALQTPGRGWRSASSAADDPFVAGWAVMALKSAHMGHLVVPRPAFDGARAWLDQVTDPTGALCGDTAAHPTTAAIGLALRIRIDSDQLDPRLARSAKLLVANLPRRSEPDARYAYFGTLAAFQSERGGGHDPWKAWNAALKDALIPTERLRRDGCVDGSWDSEADPWGAVGGRVGVTALNSLSLGTYSRCRCFCR